MQIDAIFGQRFGAGGQGPDVDRHRCRRSDGFVGGGGGCGGGCGGGGQCLQLQRVGSSAAVGVRLGVALRPPPGGSAAAAGAPGLRHARRGLRRRSVAAADGRTVGLWRLLERRTPAPSAGRTRPVVGAVPAAAAAAPPAAGGAAAAQLDPPAPASVHDAAPESARLAGRLSARIHARSRTPATLPRLALSHIIGQTCIVSPRVQGGFSKIDLHRGLYFYLSALVHLVSVPISI